MWCGVGSMRFSETEIPGLIEILADPRPDDRGRFVKTFERTEYADAGLPARFAEEFYSFSRTGVVRGMHFQLPPAAQGKTVFCDHGAVFDVVLDLRVGSPSFGRTLAFELTAENGRGLFIPEGLAHGFCTPLGDALVSYRVTEPYSQDLDAGVRWDSAGIQWPISNPTISARDLQLPKLEVFQSPFTYQGAGSDV